MGQVFGKIVKKEGKKVWLMIDESDPDFDLDNALLLGNDSVELSFDDGVSTTPNQRKFAHAVMRDIQRSQVGGYNPLDEAGWLLNEDTVKAHFKEMYVIRYGKTFTFQKGKSLKIDAAHFIELILEYVDQYNIPIQNYAPLDYLSDAGRYAHCYRSIMNNRCAICGKAQADLHHVDTVGMGNDRSKINHLGKYAIELCRMHHSELDSPYHSQKEFIDKYHVIPVKINTIIAKKHNLSMGYYHD